MVSQSMFYRSCCCPYLSLDSSNSKHPDKLVLILLKVIHGLQAKLASVFNICTLMKIHDVICWKLQITDLCNVHRAN